MIELGAAEPIAVDIYDEDGNLANAGTVALTITHPDGTTETPAVDNPPDVEGEYRYTYVPATAGWHSWHLVTTAPAAAYGDSIFVKDPYPPSFISMADAKRQLGMDPDDTSEDDDLRAWLAGVTWAIENRQNFKIARHVIGPEKVCARGGRFRLFTTPVISLDELTSLDGSVSYDPAGWYVDGSTGLAQPLTGSAVTGDLLATSTAGMISIPYNLYQAGLMLVQHVWDTKRGPGVIPGGVIGPEETMDYRHYTSMPRKVTEWLGGADVPVA